MNNPQTNLLERFRQIYEKDEYNRLLKFIHNARVPIIILSICILLALFFGYKSILLVSAFADNKSSPAGITRNPPVPTATRRIYVDLSGAVTKPQTYSVPEGTRLFELVEKAGGLSPEADRSFVQRNYNFSVILSDQQKVHIPSVYEVRDGFFTEKRRLITLDDANSPNRFGDEKSASDGISRISLNNANLEGLKSLPGVGDVTAQRIIAGRPFESISDILDRGIVKKSVYDDIVSMLEL